MIDGLGGSHLVEIFVSGGIWKRYDGAEHLPGLLALDELQQVVPVGCHEVVADWERLGALKESDLGEQFVDRVCGSAPFAKTRPVQVVQFVAPQARAACYR